VASLTIRNLDDNTKQELRIRGARRGASMEDEARSILRAVVAARLPIEAIGADRSSGVSETAWSLAERLREKYGTFDLAVPERVELAPASSIFED